MQLGRECSVYFWAGWVAWVVALLAMLYGEFLLRTSNNLSFYMLEAWLGFLAPFIALWQADNLGGSAYHKVWVDVNKGGISSKFADPEIIESIRKEFSSNLLLKAMKPPASRDSRSQLFTVSLWYPVITRPPAAGWWARFGEYCIDILLGYLPFLGAVLFFMTNEGRSTIPVTALLLSLGLTTLGYSSIRFAARRQAVLDFFAIWKTQRDFGKDG